MSWTRSRQHSSTAEAGAVEQAGHQVRYAVELRGSSSSVPSSGSPHDRLVPLLGWFAGGDFVVSPVCEIPSCAIFRRSLRVRDHSLKTGGVLMAMVQLGG
jgi:hypothetical protein